MLLSTAPATQRTLGFENTAAQFRVSSLEGPDKQPASFGCPSRQNKVVVPAPGHRRCACNSRFMSVVPVHSWTAEMRKQIFGVHLRAQTRAERPRGHVAP